MGFKLRKGLRISAYGNVRTGEISKSKKVANQWFSNGDVVSLLGRRSLYGLSSFAYIQPITGDLYMFYSKETNEFSYELGGA